MELESKTPRFHQDQYIVSISPCQDACSESRCYDLQFTELNNWFSYSPSMCQSASTRLQLIIERALIMSQHIANQNFWKLSWCPADFGLISHKLCIIVTLTQWHDATCDTAGSHRQVVQYLFSLVSSQSFLRLTTTCQCSKSSFSTAPIGFPNWWWLRSPGVVWVEWRKLSSKSVQCSALSLEGIDNIKCCHCLTASVLSVGDRIPDDILQEHLEDTSGLFVDQARDTLHTSTPSQSPDCWLGNSLDVVPEHLPVPLGSSLSCARHMAREDKTSCILNVLIWADLSTSRWTIA